MKNRREIMHKKGPKSMPPIDMSIPTDPILFDEKTGATIRQPGPKPLGTKDTVPGKAPRYSVVTEAMGVLRRLANERERDAREREAIIAYNTKMQNDDILEIIGGFEPANQVDTLTEENLIFAERYGQTGGVIFQKKPYFDGGGTRENPKPVKPHPNGMDMNA